MLRGSSSCPSKEQGGDLGYFSGADGAEFGNAAYAMKVSDISAEPVKTQFGLHLIKLVDKKRPPYALDEVGRSTESLLNESGVYNEQLAKLRETPGCHRGRERRGQSRAKEEPKEEAKKREE